MTTDPKSLSVPDMVRAFGAWLDSNQGKLARTQLADTLLWIKKHAAPYLSDEDAVILRRKVCGAFSIKEDELEQFLVTKLPAALPPDDFSGLVPQRGWFADYLAYTAQTESPTAYHFWVAATVVGACLRRRVFVDQGLWKIYPNLVVFLVGPSTKTRKTTSSDIAVKLALESSQVRLLAEKITPEALVNALAETDEAHGLIYVPEIASTFTRQKYQEGLIPLLTRLWDCPDILPTDTITRSKQTLYNVCVAMIGCSNTTWLAKLPEDAFGGGFMARIIQVYQYATIRRFPRPRKPPEALRERLIEKISMAGMIRGELMLSAAADQWYQERYNEIMDSIPDDERQAPFYGRLGDHILRLAMILMLAEENFEPRPDLQMVSLDRCHIEQASNLMSWVTKYLPKVYEALGASAIGEEAAKVLHFIEAQGGVVTRPALIRYTKARIMRKQLDEVIGTLVDAGEIIADSKGLWETYTRVNR